MGHTNSTPNIGLPQFIGTDKPTWLGDVNGAMSAIDTKIGSIDAAIATTDAKADNAVADAAGAVTTATNAVNTAGAASTTATQANNLATQALTVANNTADLCTDQIVPDVAANKTAIGTLSDLTTTDKSNLVAAINEVAQGVRTVLWSNPNPTIDFDTQTITLSSDDYDFLLMIGKSAKDSDVTMSEIVPKGYSTILSQSSRIATGILNVSRVVTYVSDTSYTADVAYRAISQDADAPTVANSRCIPLTIYGIKF